MSRRGENIYKRKDGRWEGRYKKGYVDGRIRYGYAYGGTYHEVKEKLAAIRQTACIGEHPGNGAERNYDMCFREAAEAWIDELMPELKASSIVKYRNILSCHLYPHFGDMAVRDISADGVTQFGRDLLSSGNGGNGGFSPKTVADVLSVLKRILRYAELKKGLPVVDIGRITIRQTQRNLRILTAPEQQRLTAYLCGDMTPMNLGILLCLYTGIRIGEVCALKWGDISMEGHYIYINKTMQRIQNKGITEDGEKKTSVIISSPKSSCSVRSIPLPDGIFPLIAARKCPENTFFLTGHPCNYIEPRTLQNHFKTAARNCRIGDVNFHALRHTFATRCVELGFDIKTLSEILGHANVNITLNRYVHPSMEQKRKNMDKLSEFISVNEKACQ